MPKFRFRWKPKSHEEVLDFLESYYTPNGMGIATRAEFEFEVGSGRTLECPSPADDPETDYMLGYVGNSIVLLRNTVPGHHDLPVPLKADPRFIEKFPAIAKSLEL